MYEKSIIRPLSDEELADYYHLALKSFPTEGGFDEQDIDKKIKEFEDRRNNGIKISAHGLFRQSELRGGMYFYDFKMNFHDTIALLGGVGFLAVNLLHKKEGIAKEMVQYFIEHYDLKGAGIVALYAFRLDFYQQMGFGFGHTTRQFSIRPSTLPRRDKSKLKYLSKAEQSQVVACYNRFAKQNHGMILHNTAWWNQLFQKNMLTVGCFHNDQLKGYLTFEYVKGSSTPYWFNIQVHQFIYENREAFSELIGFLASQVDQAEFIIMDSQDDTFYHLMNYPHNGEKGTVLLHHRTNVEETGIAYRVVNVKRVFEVLVDRNFGNSNLKLKIHIEDDFYPKNNGATVIHFEDGTPKVMDKEAAYEVEIWMGISHFTSLIMGAIGFKKLYDYGFAEISNKMYILSIDKLFYSSKPLCITRF